jgi:trans-2,3-dihydro-3-hydroxyanthranilate isomerase
MRTYNYRIVNVFAESIFGGNPLCVFEDGRYLSDVEMQALALQFNLSETTFILPAEDATARVRIFTPTFEMPFAGHPTLGSSFVVRDLLNAGDAITLSMKAGIIPVSAIGDRWTLKANAPTSRDDAPDRATLAATLGIDEADVLDGARWVNTGSDQLIVPLASVDAVRRVAPKPELLKRQQNALGRSMAYVFSQSSAESIESRFFFVNHDSVIEDPGTGSATANLGGWMLLNGRAPCRFTIAQGAQVGRPCHIGLEVSQDGVIRVSGNVLELGRGAVRLP